MFKMDGKIFFELINFANIIYKVTRFLVKSILYKVRKSNTDSKFPYLIENNFPNKFLYSLPR
jgi:hypothetical protein